jgi:ferredoxin
MKVHVDLDECEANAICVGIQPAVFHLDDDDVLHILVDEVPAGMEDDVRQAVNRCPKRALFITDD